MSRLPPRPQHHPAPTQRTRCPSSLDLHALLKPRHFKDASAPATMPFAASQQRAKIPVTVRRMAATQPGAAAAQRMDRTAPHPLMCLPTRFPAPTPNRLSRASWALARCGAGPQPPSTMRRCLAPFCESRFRPPPRRCETAFGAASTTCEHLMSCLNAACEPLLALRAAL